MQRAADEKPWVANRWVGAGVLVLFGAFVAWIVSEGSPGDFLDSAGVVAFATWLGSLALIHLTLRSARWMRLPGAAALLACAAWLGVFVPQLFVEYRGHGDSTFMRVLTLVPALAPGLFGVSHLLAATDGGARLFRRLAWGAVVLTLIAGAIGIVIAIGASGMGGG